MWRGVQARTRVPPSQLLRPKLLLRYRSILHLAILRTRPCWGLWARSRAVAVWRNITANAGNADCRLSRCPGPSRARLATARLRPDHGGTCETRIGWGTLPGSLVDDAVGNEPRCFTDRSGFSQSARQLAVVEFALPAGTLGDAVQYRCSPGVLRRADTLREWRLGSLANPPPRRP
jgi:hypothetical protein